MSAKRLNHGMLIFVLALFAVGLLRLIALCFSAGGMYPVCSTLRADPRGARIFKDSLDALPGIRTRHVFTPLEKREPTPGTVLFCLGLNPRALREDRDTVQALSRCAAEGERLIVSLRFAPFLDAMNRARQGEKPELVDRGDDAWGPVSSWNVIVRCFKEPGANGIDPVVEEAWPTSLLSSRDAAFPPMAWFSRFYFEPLDAAWRTLYVYKGKPVIIERHWGRGSLVLASGSYLFSNEAMIRERHGVLLSRLIGAAHDIDFLESHLGIMEQENIATMVRKYRLSGLVLALLILAGLYAWRCAVPFLPIRPTCETDEQAMALGRESCEGLIHLLQRHIDERELPATCFREWRAYAEGHAELKRYIPTLSQTLDQAMRRSSAHPDPVALYRVMARMLEKPYQRQRIDHLNRT